MILACNNCGAEIPEAAINIASDLAYCRRCFLGNTPTHPTLA
jgi:late competence protein required for DNA uptake (superfamily II DNA/RNA helicase)